MKILSKKEYQRLLDRIYSLENTNTKNFEYIKSLLKAEHELKSQIDIPYYKTIKRSESFYHSGKTIQHTRIVIPSLDFVSVVELND